ncbi:epoxide hydrolase, soluble (sEH) [Kappamyces sp. JEL0829]|nr:epoxide hydrolase, soluble (sEH) [Kappamyces sp. JEL0829]
MELVGELESGHQDLIHCLAYNYYGNRIATCSSDQKVKVFDRAEAKSSWTCDDSWKAHDSSVLKVTWSHPEFGQLLATCSFDRTIRIWEEVESEPLMSGRRWQERAKLGHARGTIQDIEFAPNHLGLKLACCAADGILRIYEAMDPMNVSSWALTDDFEISAAGREPEGQFCLSWCPSRLLPPMLVVGCGKEHSAKIFRLDGQNHWLPFEILPNHGGIVRDVAWAPNMGRSYQLIATACSDGNVRIFHLTPIPAQMAKPAAPVGRLTAHRKKNLFTVELVGEFSHHQSEVWRVEWNITGTILSSTGDDGAIRLWKSSFLKEWKMIGVIEATK